MQKKQKTNRKKVKKEESALLPVWMLYITCVQHPVQHFSFSFLQIMQNMGGFQDSTQMIALGFASSVVMPLDFNC